MMKKVKKYLNHEFLLDLLKQGKNPSQIAKELNLSKQSLNYYLSTLKANGQIKKIGYGTWEVKNYTSKIGSKKKLIRGHAFIWTVQLNKKINWINHLKSYELIRGSIPRIILNNQKIWLGKKTITIYDNRSFYGENSLESRKYAVLGLKQVLEALEKLINIKLTPFKFKICKEHYSMIKNELARQYNEKNEKMIIRDDIEGEWLWIDDSESLNELETKNIVRSKQVQDWWNDNKKFNFTVTPSFLIESIKGIVKIQKNDRQTMIMLNENFKSHMKVLNDITDAVHELRNEIKKMNNKEFKGGSQKSLFDF